MINSLTPNFPIIEQIPVSLTPAAHTRLKHLANQLCRKDRQLTSVTPFGKLVSTGLGPGPVVVLEDHSWIRLFEYTGDVAYSYRALLFAGEGDIVIVGVARNPAFETYCRKQLGLGKPELLSPAPAKPTDSLATRCLKDQQLIKTLAAHATQNNGLNVIPYMSTGSVWALADKIARNARVPIRVAGPPPHLCRCVNNKLWFIHRVTEVLSKTAVPTTFEAHNLTLLSSHVARLAKDTTCVAIKLKDSASSAGNLILESSTLRPFSLHALRDHLLAILAQRCWDNAYPLMVTAWESPVADNPSVHLWIPRVEQGVPIVEGIFDQNVSGTASEFVGAIPSRLDDAWQYQLAEGAVRLGSLFQALGYFGRCSFDAILVGRDLRTATLHWVECNGRWGGVSIPITLANRLVGNWRKHPFVIIEEAHLDMPNTSFAWLLHTLKDKLYSSTGSTVGAVVLSPGRVESGTGYELMVFGDSVDDACKIADTIKVKIRSAL